ncbi:hypothetical protein DL764_005026 [Monosporascus ibericus]|uniref:Transcription activator GCR1-like domain-containing protein n=1 Tax=Monosporascus ibericus TaxID=155417 RepID=A0A4Q4TE22_9PEZI|nr:hypothetical protein DL764_005026 [Monosporascus ibericus]
MLPSSAAGGLLSTSTSSSDVNVNHPAPALHQAPNIAAPSSASSAAATTTSAAASSASATAGAKRPAAPDLQRGPGTGPGFTPSPSKRHATGNRASISGYPIPPSTPSSATSAIPGLPPALGGASSSSSPGAVRHRHARSHSHAAAPAMSAPTTTSMISLPQPTLAAPPPQYPPTHSSSRPYPHAPDPLPPPLPPTHQHPPQTTITEDQLLGRSPDQLVATILQIQSQHQQYVAHLSAQYENIMQQLSELRASLLTFYGGQVANHQAAMSAITTREPSSSISSRPMVPPPPLSQPQPVPVHTPRPPTSHSHGESSHSHGESFHSRGESFHSRGESFHSRTESSRMPRPSPASHADLRLAPKPSTQIPTTPGPPAYDYRTVGTVEDVWKEYREGMGGQPAIEELDANWGSRWRPEPRGRTWYSRRKVIWDRIKENMEHGMSEEDAVKEVERLRDGGTINKLIRMLQDEKKEKGGRDATA